VEVEPAIASRCHAKRKEISRNDNAENKTNVKHPLDIMV
jgi:hypothetical protein